MMTEQDIMIVEAIPSLHPDITEEEEKALWEVLEFVNGQNGHKE